MSILITHLQAKDHAIARVIACFRKSFLEQLKEATVDDLDSVIEQIKDFTRLALVALKIFYAETSLLIFTDENFEAQDIVTTEILKNEVYDEVIQLFVTGTDETILNEKISKYQHLTCETLG